MAGFDFLFVDLPNEKLKINRIYEALEHGNPLFWTLAGTLLIGLVGLIDYLTGKEINFSLFYLIPIVVATWAANRDIGFLLSFLSSLSWLAMEYATGRRYSHASLYFWNTLILAGSFVICATLVSELQRARRQERLTARTDYVTGVANARYFHELLEMEVERIRRYPSPITVVYIDIDNFKLVNDLLGHQRGDEVLRCIAGELKSQLRKTDTVARIGGDEFGLLLPAARQPEAEIIVSKLRLKLAEAMKQNHLPVTFSMGVVTCLADPPAAEQLLSLADRLMYSVKNSHKNGVRFMTVGDQNLPA